MYEVFEFGIIGMGPAGIGMALSLRGTSHIKNTVCFERGNHIPNMNCQALSQNDCCYSNVCSIISGVGGASNLSSGKISDFPAGSGLADFFDSEQQLRELLGKVVSFFTNRIALKKVEIDTETTKCAKSFYGQRNINYKYYDVYEFDGKSYQSFLQETIQELREEGLQLFDNAEVIDINRDSTTLCFCIKVKTPNGEKIFFVRNLILATGALDIQDRLIEKMVGPVANHFEIGVRIEASSNAFGDALSTHGDLKLKLGAGRTYCVTANGKIISYQTGGVHFLEGCREPSAPTDYTNLAILIKGGDEAIFDFISRYREKFNGLPIKQRFVDYIKGQVSDETISTTLASATCGDINDLLSLDINNAIKEFIRGVLVEAMGIPAEAITLVAPELKILRNLQIAKNFEVDSNLFVVGAATGRFRGILQSFCSGVRCGHLLVRR